MLHHPLHHISSYRPQTTKHKTQNNSIYLHDEVCSELVVISSAGDGNNHLDQSKREPPILLQLLHRHRHRLLHRDSERGEAALVLLCMNSVVGVTYTRGESLRLRIEKCEE